MASRPTRALENFPISGLRAPAELVTATILVKKCAAEANVALGRLAADVGGAVIAAADEVLGGALRDQFVVDIYQAGAGTSHNMNANEVLANRAGELLGDPRGAYARVHPNDHVNMGQSTNDVYPTATRLALLLDDHGPGRLGPRAGRGARCEGAGIQRRLEGGPHASAGRGADDAGPGAWRLRRVRSPWGRRRGAGGASSCWN